PIFLGLLVAVFEIAPVPLQCFRHHALELVHLADVEQRSRNLRQDLMRSLILAQRVPPIALVVVAIAGVVVPRKLGGGIVLRERQPRQQQKTNAREAGSGASHATTPAAKPSWSPAPACRECSSERVPWRAARDRKQSPDRLPVRSFCWLLRSPPRGMSA